MRGASCIGAELRVVGRSAGLSAAERLRLEEHLSSCNGCSAEAAWLDGIAGVIAAQPAQLDTAARQRVIEAALLEAAAPSAQRVGNASQAPRVRVLALGALGVGAAAAAALLMFGGQARLATEPAVGLGAAEAPEGLAAAGTDSTTTAMRAKAPQAAKTAAPGVLATATSPGQAGATRVLRGRVTVDGKVLQAGAALPDGATLVSEDGAELALGRARVELRARSAVRWSAERDVLSLERGRVHCDVDTRRNAAGDPRDFKVRTERFTAVVLGTRFEVAASEVVVHEGHVRVVAPDGKVLAEALGAGQRFELAAEAAGPRARTGQDAARKANRASLAERNNRAQALLARARAQLGGGAGAEAQRAIDGALALAPGRTLRAEALSLRAETHLVQGERRAAVAAYLRVARQFPRTDAGDNALFAAARLEANAGGKRARQLLDRYLDEYPAGRFVREARSRRKALSATPTP